MKTGQYKLTVKNAHYRLNDDGKYGLADAEHFYASDDLPTALAEFLYNLADNEYKTKVALAFIPKKNKNGDS